MNDNKSGKNDIALDKWRELYDLAGKIKRLAPWKGLWDSDLFIISLPQYPEPFYCSTMGRNGECFAIGVYPGSRGINSYIRMIEASRTDPPFITGLTQVCSLCYYGNREEVTEQDREIYKALDVKFRGSNEWIYFRSMEPGYFPWYLDSEHVDSMIAVLGQYIEAYLYWLTLPKQDDPDADIIIRRFYSVEKEQWENIYDTINSIECKTNKVTITDDLFVSRLKKQKLILQSIEYDCVYLPFQIREKKSDRPVMPWILLLADRKSGYVLNQHMGSPQDSIANAVLGMITEYINKYGRPTDIYIRDEWMAEYTEDFCKKIGIKLHVKKTMHAMNRIITQLSNSGF